MKNSNILLILSFTLIHSIITINQDNDNKEIIINGILSNLCSITKEEYIMTFSIQKKGFTTKEMINFRLKEPSYIEVYCEIPETTSSDLSIQCSLDTKIFPLFYKNLEFPDNLLTYKDITIQFDKLRTIESAQCNPDYGIKFSLFEKTANYLCSSNQIKISGNLDGTSGTLEKIVTSFWADNTLQKDFDAITSTIESSGKYKYSILLTLPKRYIKITFFPTMGKVNGKTTMIDIEHFTYNINCPDSSSNIYSYIDIKISWLLLIIFVFL